MIRIRKAVSPRGCLSFLLALMLLLPLFPAGAGNGEAAEKGGGRKLIVGTTNAIQGDFLNGMFSNGTSDFDVRTMIHGYNLVYSDGNQGIYTIDSSVVRDVMVLDNDAGDRTYYLILEDGLYYSDGTEITSWDYAFSILLSMNPEMEKIGGTIGMAEHIYGGGLYSAGETSCLSGVHILSDRQLSITLDHAYLPYFQELGLLMYSPLPIGKIAPGCAVYDDGNGVYIGSAEKKDAECPFSAELLRETLLDEEKGFLSHPSLSSGPYILTSFDGTTAEFEKNPYFKGTMDEKTATIDRVAYTVISADEARRKLDAGEIHLINKLAWKGAIEECKKGSWSSVSYGRTGLTMIAFTCEKPTVAEPEVRQAIAWCLDRDALTKAYCGSAGIRVDGYFGKGQWEYLLSTQAISSPGNLEELDNAHKDEEKTSETVWKTLNLNNLTQYHVDTVKANALLDKAGWTLNSDGEPYDSSKDQIRGKEIDGKLVSLDLTLMYAEGNHIADTLERDFINNLKRCGIRLTLLPREMKVVSRTWYRQIPRETDMIYMGTSFSLVSDPAQDFLLAGAAPHGERNITGSSDDDLYWRAVSLRQTEPKDIYGYMTKWIAFQERFNENLPGIPVYSSDYSDFWVKDLKGYEITKHKSWAQAILGAEFR